MSNNYPLVELLNRNTATFKDKEIIVCGDIDNQGFMNLAKFAKKITFIIDNYAIAKECAALIGQSLGNSLYEEASFKHIRIIFSAIDLCVDKIDSNYDCLVILLNKAKALSVKLLSKLSPKIKNDGLIYIAAENSKGGKSANSLFKGEDCFKLDTARKSTIWCAKNSKAYVVKDKEKFIDFECNEVNLKLLQNEGIFSFMAVDLGTKLLLNEIKNFSFKSTLDLGTGCGIIGIYLAKKGLFNITLSDISAEALYLAYQNAKLNNVQEQCSFVASDMLDDVASYDFIVTNPPFHQGIKTAISKTEQMLCNSIEHLNDNGSLLLVCNAFLNYENSLNKVYCSVKCLNNTTKFKVISCTK